MCKSPRAHQKKVELTALPQLVQEEDDIRLSDQVVLDSLFGGKSVHDMTGSASCIETSIWAAHRDVPSFSSWAETTEVRLTIIESQLIEGPEGRARCCTPITPTYVRMAITRRIDKCSHLHRDLISPHAELGQVARLSAAEHSGGLLQDYSRRSKRSRLLHL